jgi:putative ABC transport system permease protein
MTIFDILHETYSALTSNKVRSGLTILGIVIGISSVITMISIGQGAQTSINASIQSIGSNLILVMPGAQRGPGMNVSAGRGSAKSLTLSDAEAISLEVTDIKAVAPEVTGRYQVTAKGTNTNTQVIGTVSAYPSVRNVEVENGNFFTDQNVKNGDKVAIIGPTTRDDLFGVDADPIGQTIRIKKLDFKVIGVTKSKGGTGFGSSDDMVYVPISTAQRYFSGDAYVSTISIAGNDATVGTSIQQQVTDLLILRHKVTALTMDFNVMNQADIVATASSVTGIFTILLASVAGISLIVGGIGIMNMMLTTVTERTREIGLRKAIGAKQRDISIQFLVEAVMLTFFGGFVGVVLGWTASYLVTYFGLLQTTVSISSILLAFGVSAGIGIIFGYYPARRAAKMNPIEALRYE